MKEEQVISKEQRIIVKLLNENFGEKGLSNDRCPIRQDSISQQKQITAEVSLDKIQVDVLGEMGVHNFYHNIVRNPEILASTKSFNIGEIKWFYEQTFSGVPSKIHQH